MKADDHSLSSGPTLRPLTWWCAALPFVAVHLSYLISAYSGQIDWCNPYWDSCTSISNAGRKHPASIIFKTMMICAAMLMLAYWFLVTAWLRRMGDDNDKVLTTLGLMGAYAALALILYSATLGTAEYHLKGLRRIGITLFFAFTAFGHLLMVYRLSKRELLPGSDLYISWRRQTAISYLLVALGLTSGLLSAFYSHYDDIENAFEWCFALIMILQFPITGKMWQQSGFQISLRSQGPGLDSRRQQRHS